VFGTASYFDSFLDQAWLTQRKDLSVSGLQKALINSLLEECLARCHPSKP